MMTTWENRVANEFRNGSKWVWVMKQIQVHLAELSPQQAEHSFYQAFELPYQSTVDKRQIQKFVRSTAAISHWPLEDLPQKEFSGLSLIELHKMLTRALYTLLERKSTCLEFFTVERASPLGSAWESSRLKLFRLYIIENETEWKKIFLTLFSAISTRFCSSSIFLRRSSRTVF